MDSTVPDLTAQELTDTIFPVFDNDSGNPELPPQQVEVHGWLDEQYDPSKVTMRSLEGGLEGYGIVLENLLTRRECLQIIQETEKIGYGHLGTGSTGQAYRGNKRLQVDDTGGAVAAELWRRMKQFIPLEEDLPDDGKFKFKELNSR